MQIAEIKVLETINDGKTVYRLAQEQADNSPPLVGGDMDEHGCKGSAGYRWCSRLEQCVRPWELAKKAGFENTPEQFDAYCAQ